jgi:hypothetical protein
MYVSAGLLLLLLSLLLQ